MNGPRFAPGDRVRVDARDHEGHCRTPTFLQADVWPDYRGGPNDTVAADIYEHWLEAAP